MPPTETAVRETFQTAFAFNPSKLEEGEFQGLASVFNHEVNAFIPTIVESGAFKKTIRERGDRIKLLWQHNRDEPIGFPIELKETDEGLFVHGKISDTARGRDALALMRDGQELGKSLELSIGFEAIRWSMEKRKGSKGEEIRRLQEVRLNEVSFVTLAADDKAHVTEVRKETDGGDAGTLEADDLKTEDRISLGEFVSPVIKELTELPHEVEFAGEAGDDNSTFPRLAGADVEGFAGRSLSTKNRKRLAQVVSILNQLLESAEPPKPHPDKKKGREDKQALTEMTEQWMDAELTRARAQLNRLNGG